MYSITLQRSGRHELRLPLASSLHRKLLTLAITLFPVYIFPSGGLQPSHFVFLVLSLLIVIEQGIPKKNWLLLLALLSIYSLVIESVAGAFAGDMRNIINAAFFLFNFLLMVGVYRVVLRYGVVGLRVGVLCATSTAVVSLYFGGVDLREMGEGGRPTGTFNNPNQLGFFSVCILSLAYLLYAENTIRFVTLLTLLAGSIFLAIASLSKAAMIANFIVLAFALRPRGGGMMMLLWLVLAAGVIGAAAWLVASGNLDQFLFFDRIVNMGQEKDSSLLDRGYLAFLDGNIVNLFFGLGSPEVYRIVGHEVHSTFATIWNTYGVFGFCLFSLIFAIWIRALFRAYGLVGIIALVGPSILYGITHNGTRFSIFWLLVAASMGGAELRRLQLREEQC